MQVLKWAAIVIVSLIVLLVGYRAVTVDATNARVAEQIRARDPKRIITGQDEEKPPEPGSDDEFYAKFEVPDDLDW